MFRKTIAPLFALSLLFAPLAYGQDAAHRAAAEEMLELANMEQLLEKSIDQSLDMQIQANPGLEPYRDTMRTFISKHMSYDSLREPLVDIYTDTFTEDELQKLTAFYSTPVGKKALDTMPDLMQKGAELGMARVQENIGELQQMIAAKSEEIEAQEQAESDAAQQPDSQ